MYQKQEGCSMSRDKRGSILDKEEAGTPYQSLEPAAYVKLVILSKQIITRWKSTIETLEKGVEYVQS